MASIDQNVSRESVSMLLKNLDLQATDVPSRYRCRIRDIMSFKMAPVTQEGAIYAVDNSEKCWREMKLSEEDVTVSEVSTWSKGGEKDANLPEK